MKKKIEFLIAISISLILLEFGCFNTLCWYWSGFKWSPFGYETCGMEGLAVVLFAYPSFILGFLIRCVLLFRWKVPHYVWYVPLILCGISSCAFEKSLVLGIFCIISMLVLPIFDWFGGKKAIRK